MKARAGLRRGLRLASLLVLAGVLAACVSPARPTLPATLPPAPAEEVTLTLGSWRPEDAQQVDLILGRFHAHYPHITLGYDPTSAADYNAALQAQLAAGTAPDLFYLRSFSISRQLYEQGYLAALDDLPGLQASFTPTMRAPWATAAGVPYGVPFIATSHGVYYNQSLFAKLHLTVPATWEALLQTAQTIQAAGYIPFANASGDTWTMGELVFMNLAPDFVGGREGRQAYLTGKRCFNDTHIVEVFQAMADLAPFLPLNEAAFKYADSQQLFLQGQAAMWLGGSWDIPFFEAQKPAFAWSVFAVPPPAGRPTYVTFQLDAGVGLNAASAHQAEAKTFLEWLTTPELADMLGNELPGFFPMQTQPPVLTDEHALAFQALTAGRGTDIRFVWEKLTDGTPSAYDLVRDGAVAVVRGQETPQAAADALQAGLAQWFPPARTCGAQP